MVCGILSSTCESGVPTEFNFAKTFGPVILTAKKIDLSLNVILLPGCFLKTFIDIMRFSVLFYVFTCLFTCVVFYSPFIRLS